MSNDLTFFSEMNVQNKENFSDLSCYQGLSEESIRRLELRASKIQKIAGKASFDIAIELCEARDEYRHNKHGGFEGWVEERLKFSRKTAYRIIDRYDRFGTVSNLTQLDIVLSAQYQLSAPSVPLEARNEALDIAESGEKITIAKANELVEKWQHIAEENRKKADSAQKQLNIFQSHSQLAQNKIDELTQQIATLTEEIKTLETPETIEVTSQETLDRIASMEAQISTLNKQKKSLYDETEKLTVELRAQRDANEARRKQEQYEHQIREGWKKATEALYKSLSQFIGQIPSPIAIQVFEGDDWARYDQIDQTLIHFLETFRGIKTTRYSDQFVESSTVDDAVIYGANRSY